MDSTVMGEALCYLVVHDSRVAEAVLELGKRDGLEATTMPLSSDAIADAQQMAERGRVHVMKLITKEMRRNAG